MRLLRQLRKAIWQWLCRPDGFKAGVVTILLLLGLYFSDSPEFHRGLRNLDARLIDWMFQWRLKWRGPTPTEDRCVIVDIDDKSLAELGQWPWPRTKMAELLRRVSDAEPARIGIDMVFAEPDRLSPRRYARDLAEQTGIKLELPEDSLDNDVVFGDALADDLPVVMGYVFVLEKDETAPPEQSPFPDCNISWVPTPPDDFDIPLVHAYRPLLNVPEIGDGALTEGFFNAWNGVDAVVREVPLFIAYDGRPFPSLVMEMYRASMADRGEEQEEPESGDIQDYELVWGPNGMLEVRIGRKHLPTTPKGNAMLNWRGPGGPSRTSRRATCWPGESRPRPSRTSTCSSGHPPRDCTICVRLPLTR